MRAQEDGASICMLPRAISTWERLWRKHERRVREGQVLGLKTCLQKNCEELLTFQRWEVP